MTRQGEDQGKEEKLQSIIKARDDYVAQVLKANQRLRENNDALREEVEGLKIEALKVRGKPGSVVGDAGLGDTVTD